MKFDDLSSSQKSALRAAARSKNGIRARKPGQKRGHNGATLASLVKAGLLKKGSDGTYTTTAAGGRAVPAPRSTSPRKNGGPAKKKKSTAKKKRTTTSRSSGSTSKPKAKRAPSKPRQAAPRKNPSTPDRPSAPSVSTGFVATPRPSERWAVLVLDGRRRVRRIHAVGTQSEARVYANGVRIPQGGCAVIVHTDDIFRPAA